MKKIVSLLLAILFALSLLSLVGCGKINDANVAVLWSGEATTQDPNSLLNAMDRAMYIERIAYEYYGAKGDAAEQLKQAKAALDAGCAALIVEPVSLLLVQEIVDAAKAKGVPVVFIGSIDLIPDSVTASYDKCVVVASDLSSVADVKGQMIADYVKANFSKMDKNADGKISYFAYDMGVVSAPAVKKANELLATEDYVVKNENKEKINIEIVQADVDLKDLVNVPVETYEMILTADDETAFAVLCKLQEKDYNTNKLTTHYVPVFTVGDSVDYKEIVVLGRPEIPEELKILETDSSKVIKQKNKEIRTLEDLKTYYEKNQYLVDLTVVDESELDEMIFTTRNVIESGRLAGTVLQDNDALVCAAAKVVSNMLKGKDTFDGVASKTKDDAPASVVVEGANVKVRYIALTN